MLGSKISNSIYQKDNTINISLTDKDYRDSDKSIFEYSNYSKKLLSNASQNSNYSNTLILTDSYYITQKNKQTLEKRFSNDFEIFKEKFENFLRF